MTVFAPAAPDEPAVAEVLARHFALMRAQSPEESCHVLPGAALAAPDIHVFALREAETVLAVGALRVTGSDGELKSMHTVAESRGRGHGRRLLCGVLEEARRMGVQRIYLETGSGDEHAAARRLYTSEGFALCGPFGAYKPDPLSVFMSRSL